MEASVSHALHFHFLETFTNITSSEEEDPEEYPFPLTLKSRKNSGASTPTLTNGNGVEELIAATSATTI